MVQSEQSHPTIIARSIVAIASIALATSFVFAAGCDMGTYNERLANPRSPAKANVENEKDSIETEAEKEEN